MADDLTIQAKNLAQNRASSSAMISVVGGIIGILEAHDSSIAEEVSEMFSILKQKVIAAQSNTEHPLSSIVQHFVECYIKELDNIQIQRESSRTRTERRLKENSVPEL